MLTMFLFYRELIRQHRVRLHVHFFLSLALSGMVVILWNLLVHRDTIVVLAKDQTVLYTNPVSKQTRDAFVLLLLSEGGPHYPFSR